MKELKFNPNIYDTIRKNIKKYRKKKGLTSAEQLLITFQLKLFIKFLSL